MTVLSPTRANEFNFAKRWLALFILAHIILWTLGPLLFRYSLTHDALEGIAWGSQWQWGYNKHPFLAAWLSYGAATLAYTASWPSYLLAQLAVALTFWAVWRLALQFVLPNQALLATLSLEGVLFYNLNSSNFTPDTLQSPLWALLTFCFYRGLTTQAIGSWLWVGALTALCVVTKYQAVLLLLPMLAVILMNAKMRLSFKMSGLYLAVLVCLVLISPHLIWLYQHDFITVKYALTTPAQYSKAPQAWPHLFYPLNFISNSVIFTVFVAVLLWPIYRGPRKVSSLTELQWQFLLTMGLGPWILSLVLCVITGNHFPARWATPYFFLVGIIVLSLVNPTLSAKSLKKFLITVAAFMVLLWSAQFGRLQYLNNHENRGDSALPNILLAQQITALWHEHYHTRLAYIAGSRYLVSALVGYSPDKPTPYFSFNAKESPWISERNVQKKGTIVIIDRDNQYAWDKESSDSYAVEAALKQHFPGLSPPMRLEVPRMSKQGRPIVIWVTFIPPLMVAK